MFSLSVKGVLRKALDEQYIKIDVFTFVNILYYNKYLLKRDKCLWCWVHYFMYIFCNERIQLGIACCPILLFMHNRIFLSF